MPYLHGIHLKLNSMKCLQLRRGRDPGYLLFLNLWGILSVMACTSAAQKGFLFQASGERVGISQVEVYERVGKSVILVCKQFQKV